MLSPAVVTYLSARLPLIGTRCILAKVLTCWAGGVYVIDEGVCVYFRERGVAYCERECTGSISSP